MTLSVENLGVWLPGSGLSFQDLSFEFELGQVVMLAAGNGAGASTLLRAIIGLLNPGERRSGKVSWAGEDITDCYLDELVDIFTLVGFSSPAASLSLADLLAKPRHGRKQLFDKTALASELGLVDELNTRVGRADKSLIIRAELAGALLANSPVLLVDQIYALLSSTWQAKVGKLLQQYSEAGGLVLWADQQIDQVLTVADQVFDLEHPDNSGPAWQWLPIGRPATAFQQVALAAGVQRVGANTVTGLRTMIMPRLGHHVVVPPADKNAKDFCPLKLPDGSEIMINATEPLVFICATQSDARQCMRQLLKFNEYQLARLSPDRSIISNAELISKNARLSAAELVDYYREFLPTLRAESWLAKHSSGEQQLVRLAEQLRAPELVISYEPLRYLDTANMERAKQQIWKATASRKAVVMVSTDVELASWCGRTMVWQPSGIIADGRGTSVISKLPVRPLLGQVCGPRPCLDPSILIANLSQVEND